MAEGRREKAEFAGGNSRLESARRDRKFETPSKTLEHEPLVALSQPAARTDVMPACKRDYARCTAIMRPRRVIRVAVATFTRDRESMHRPARPMCAIALKNR